MAIDKEVRAAIMRRLYANVPIDVILADPKVKKIVEDRNTTFPSRRTVERWKNETENGLEDQINGEKLDGVKEAENVGERDKKPTENDVPFPEMTPVPIDHISDHVLLGMWNGWCRIQRGLERCDKLEGNERNYTEQGYLKELRQYGTVLGKWGGLDNRVVSTNPLLDSLTNALQKAIEEAEDDE